MRARARARRVIERCASAPLVTFRPCRFAVPATRSHRFSHGGPRAGLTGDTRVAINDETRLAGNAARAIYKRRAVTFAIRAVRCNGFPRLVSATRLRSQLNARASFTPKLSLAARHVRRGHDRYSRVCYLRETRIMDQALALSSSNCSTCHQDRISHVLRFNEDSSLVKGERREPTSYPLRVDILIPFRAVKRSA